jgi:hypothetical protein
MGRFTRHGMDEQPLEGGARGGGGGKSSKADLYGPIAGAATISAGMMGLAAKNDAAKEREAAAEIKRESRGVEKSVTDKARDAAKVISDDEKYTKERPEQKYAKGGSVGSASKRADGIAQKGKTKGRFV